MVEQSDIVGDHVACIKEDLVEAETLNLIVPRVCPKHAIQLLGDVPESRQVLAVCQDELGAYLDGLVNGHQLLDASAPGLVITSG